MRTTLTSLADESQEILIEARDLVYRSMWPITAFAPQQVRVILNHLATLASALERTRMA